MQLESDTFLLTGEGQFLRVFNHATGRLLVETQIFHSQCIHGITVYVSSNMDRRAEESTLLVWGGRSVRVVRAVFARDPAAGHDALRISCIGAETRCSDWILDVAFQPHELKSDGGISSVPSAVLVTGHNELLILRILRDQTISSEYQVLVKSLVAGPRSVLYSAHVLWLSPTLAVVAAGTVFGEVLLWSSRSEGILCRGSYPTAHLLHRFTGHEGSIFGVHISHEILDLETGHPRRLLASCSDDRQIRVWKIPDLNVSISAGQCSPGKDPSQEQDMDFTHSHTAEEVSRPGKCIASGWAHVSRIWSVRFLPHLEEAECPRDSIGLISLGEDATAQRWSLTFRIQSQSAVQLPVEPEAQLKHVSTWDYHSGKNIWSSSLTTYNPSSWVLVTGGADGKIVTYEIPQKETAAVGSYVSMDTSIDRVEIIDGNKTPIKALTDLPGLGSQQKHVGFDTPFQEPTLSGVFSQQHLTQDLEYNTPELDSLTVKRYTWVDKDNLLATTVAGQVIIGSLCNTSSAHSGCWSQSAAAKTPTSVTWELIGQFDILGSYSMLVGVPAYRMVFLSGTDGTTYVYDHETRAIHPFLAVHRKASALFAQVIPPSDLTAAKNGQIVGLVVGVQGSSTVRVWLLQREHTHISRVSLDVLRSWNLELPSPFLITSVQFVCSFNLLLLGSRNGALTVYDLSSAKETPGNISPRAYFPRLHGEDATTVILAVPQPPGYGEHRNLHILTAGRNGTYSIHRLYYQQHADKIDEIRLETVHTCSPPMGRNIEGACFHAVSGDLILWGFRSQHFVVWNETKQIETMSIQCGGSHREWSYSYDDHESDSLLWTKASKLNLYRQLQPSHRVVQQGGHGREIKALAIFTPRNVTGNSPTSLIVTGAEDTSLRLFVHQNDPASRTNPDFRCSGVFRKHTTGIQHLQWCGDTGYLFSSGGFEEFLVWRARRMPGFGFGMVCEASCPVLGVPLDLRVMSFHVLDMTDKSAVIDQQACFLICVIYSDSTIRVSINVFQTR